MILPHAPISMESRACHALVETAPVGGRGRAGVPRARRLCADALRAWRAAGDRARAKWFRYHISWIGYPLSEQQLAGSSNRHQAWRERHAHLLTNAPD